jgi:anti-sigma factor RsiW
MNCDQAFDCLTDPQQRYSVELERHLAGCPRCRNMHETLEPALDLFDEIIAEPGASTPLAAGPVLSTESVRLAEQTAAQLSAARPTARRAERSWWFVWRYAAVFLFGGAIVLGIGAVQGKLSGPESPRGATCTWRNRAAMSVSEAGNPQAVTLSCVACHLPSAPQ